MSELSLPSKAYLLACDVERATLPDRQRVALPVHAAGAGSAGGGSVEPYTS